MRRIAAPATAALALLGAPAAAVAAAPLPAPAPMAARAAGGLAAPAVGGRAVLLWNPRTGDVLDDVGSRARVSIASTTKMMTARLVLAATRPDELVTISPHAQAIGESEIFLTAGERLTVDDLLQALMLKSANDAAVALAEHVAGSETAFVARMNAEARRLGLDSTHFETPYGLDVAGHYSSARDLARLARAAMADPRFRRLVATRSADLAAPRGAVTNLNVLLGRLGIDGVKTGNTRGAGWCLVVHAVRGPVELYGVILGAPDEATRNADMQRLVAWGETRYHRVTAVTKGQTLATATLPDGAGTMALVAARSVRPLVLGAGRVTLEVVAPSAVSLPVAKGQELGAATVVVGGRTVSQVPVVAARAAAAPTWRQRLSRLLDGFF